MTTPRKRAEYVLSHDLYHLRDREAHEHAYALAQDVLALEKQEGLRLTQLEGVNERVENQAEEIDRLWEALIFYEDKERYKIPPKLNIPFSKKENEEYWKKQKEMKEGTISKDKGAVARRALRRE